MLKALNIKLYPNNKQIIYLSQIFGCYRKVYNLCLSESKKQYEENSESNFCSLPSFSNYFHKTLLKQDDLLYLKEHNTKILKDSLNNLNIAFKRFFKHESGYPKFKKRSNEQKISLYKEAFSKKIFNVENKLFISKKFGEIKYKTSDEYKKLIEKYKNNIQRVTIKKTKSGEYFARILIDTQFEDDKQLNNPKNDIIGVDLGIKEFVITSDGKTFENIKIKRNNKDKLAKLHREISRRKKGSNNRNKSRKKLAKYYEKLNNIKNNYLHEVTNKLLDDNQVIVIEDLNVKDMVKNHKLARSIQELSLSTFTTMLKYKANWYGRELVKIDRWYPSSKTCSCCGWKNNNLKLKDREFICQECGIILDRDINAGINIKNEGLRMLNKKHTTNDFTVSYNNFGKDKIGSRTPELTPLESSPLGSH